MRKFAIFLISLCLFFSYSLYGNLQNAIPEIDNNGWTIVNIYEVNSHASGLAYDGEIFYIGSYGGGHGDKMYTFDPETEELELLFEGDQEEALGLTYDGEYLWTINQTGATTPAIALQLDMEGNEVSQFDLPGSYMSGIAWDDGNFWVATYFPNPGTIHHVDDEGNEISSFTPPTDQPWDLALQGDSIWIIDYWSELIHFVESDGTLIESFPYDDHRASGIYYDDVFLWYLGRDSSGNSTLYKVDPWGTGTPVIQVPPSYSFGNVTIEESADWDMNIINDGSGDLIVDSIIFPEENEAFSIDADFPVTVEPGDYEEVTVTFAPEEIAIYEKEMVIYSNDPANPEVEVLLSGNGLASGPYLVTEQEVIDFGTVRINSTNREFMELKNMGDEPLVFESIEFYPDDFYWDWTVEFPLTLSPVQKKDLPFWFQPSIEGDIEGEATLTFNNENQSPYTIYLEGVSEDIEYPLGSVIWDLTLAGGSFDNPRAIMNIPDVTGDNIDDVIVCTRGLEIKLFNGNACSTSELIWKTEIGTVEYPKAIDLMDDINEDGYHDFVIGTAYGDRAVTAVSSRTGDIIWRFETNIFGDGGWVYMVDVKYDYNGNGYKDVLAATGDDGTGTGPKRIFLLDGKTGDMIWETSMGGAAFSVLAVEDFTGDGLPDVIGGGQTPTDQGRVIGINGSNGSIEWEFITDGTSVWALEQIDDITDNGIKDIIVGSFNGFYYLLDVTNGDVLYTGGLGNAIILDFWIAGDLNEDGYTDILPAYSTVSNAVAISGKNGQLLWSTPISDQSWSVTPLNDITGNGINDVAVGTLFNNNNVYFISGSDGEILETHPMPDAVDAIRAIPDITGDYSMEVVAASRNNYLVALSGGTDAVPQYYEVTFVVTDDEDPANPIEGAKIVIEETSDTIITNEEGIAIIEELKEGFYNYKVTKENYHKVEESFQLDQDKTIEVILSGVEDPLFIATFVVTDDQDPANPVEGATIDIVGTGYSIITDEQGIAELELEEGDYDFIVNKEGYYEVEGSFTIEDEDKTIEIVMEADGTHISEIGGPIVSKAYNYPNPFSEFTNIYFTLNRETTVSVYVYDMRGNKFNIFEPQIFSAGTNKIQWNGTGPDGSPLIDGMYFFEVQTENNIYRNKMLILRN